MEFITTTYPWQMWGVLALLVLSIVLYTRTNITIEISSFGILLLLLLFFFFFPLKDNQADAAFLLAGFANPALLSIMALLVIGQGMLRAQALEGFTQALVKIGKKYTKIVIGSILIFVFATTAWLNNTPVAIMFIPILVSLAARTNAAPGKIMMPLSFVCILGGMTTLIGSSTNILAVDVATRLGADSFGFFDITKAGLTLAIPGLIYVLFIMPFFLPQRSEHIVDTPNPDGRHYIVQIDVGLDSQLINMEINKNHSVVDDSKHLLNNMRILRIQRGEKSFYPARNDVVIQLGDQVIASANREVLANAIKSRSDVFGLNQLKTDERILADAVVAPGSRMIGRSLSQITLQYETGCHIVGILRRKRMLRAMIQDIRFEAGDVLLVVGFKQAVRELSHSYDVFLLDWLSTELPHYSQAIKAFLIFTSMVLVTALGILPLIISSILGAVAMILSGVLNLRQAIRAFDQRIFFLVATTIGLASALEITEAPTFLANFAITIFNDPQPITVFTAMFLVISLTTNLLSNNAAAILFMPIMLKLANLMSLDAELAIITVILAANCSFATPMAYQTNLLVMGPGRYQFKDFLRAGTPLIFLLTIAYIFMAKTLYGL